MDKRKSFFFLHESLLGSCMCQCFGKICMFENSLELIWITLYVIRRVYKYKNVQQSR